MGRIAAVARGAIDGDAIKSRLDMPTLDHVLAVEEWRNGRKWAGSGKAAFISLSGLSGQRLLTESQAGALENGLEKPLLA